MATYTPTEERIFLAETVLEEPVEATSQRMRARQTCASSRGNFQWMRIDVCASRAGGTLPAEYLHPMKSSLDAVKLFRAFLGTAHLEIKELFAVIALDSRFRPLGFFIPGVGSVSHATVPPLEVFKPAVLLPATAIIIAHNHPSGETSPSHDDIELTKRLVEIGKVLGVRVLDHLILTHDGHASLVDMGLMSPA
jgi:DNA repair protein RadC